MTQNNNPLKVMSFNIRYGTADDGLNSWPFRKEAALKMLRDSECLVIGLQEVLAHQLVEIQEELPYYQWVGVGRDDGDKDGEHCAILFDSRQIVVESSETFWFSETPAVIASTSWGNQITRICTKGSFVYQGIQFSVYNLHIDHESAQSRLKSIELLVDRIQNGGVTTSTIVTGDFNADESSDPVQLMKSAGFQDSYRLIHPDSLEPATYHGWIDSIQGDKIDYVFVKNGFKVIDAEVVREKPLGRFVSDHYPVVALFELN